MILLFSGCRLMVTCISVSRLSFFSKLIRPMVFLLEMFITCNFSTLYSLLFGWANAPYWRPWIYYYLLLTHCDVDGDLFFFLHSYHLFLLNGVHFSFVDLICGIYMTKMHFSTYIELWQWHDHTTVFEYPFWSIQFLNIAPQIKRFVAYKTKGLK